MVVKMIATIRTFISSVLWLKVLQAHLLFTNLMFSDIPIMIQSHHLFVRFDGHLTPKECQPDYQVPAICCSGSIRN
ncbi:hypothetical protein BDB00DRAFT_181213 [Zychaea mexicana]|uniref:uncharacterized protein n=1 Tax=Zychaea mexicana TaxID=64656 RepID=UPI0022FE9340|nr:uncharacterized protein BDB00DRAFT_181213 [Zychaea mexicana]KAI9496023.1 hypothetical protein BDB00DRAFT_181213 [Zychaea mexicana]